MATILVYPNDALKQKCKPVERVTPELQATAKEMFRVMVEANGLGLAANQVGLDIRLIVLLDGDAPLYIFNPKILERSKEKIDFEEGCLSFPGKYIKIKRESWVKIQYRDFNNKVQFKKLDGILARAFLHEYDHLLGIVFTDHEKV